jgi:hypothetical protein
MASLTITPEMRKDIAALQKIDIEAAATAILLLESLQEDHEQLEYLCVPDNHFLYCPPFEVKKFGEAQRLGYNIFILKFLDEYGSLPSYRILIGFHAQRSTYYALAVTHRNISYRPSDDAFRDLLARYEQCGIPHYR